MPPSKSLHQRALVLAALADGPVAIEAEGRPGDDVRRLEAALARIGPWSDGALGTGRDRRALDLGLNATGFRFASAVSTLRPSGARTLVTGRPQLLDRPHRPLRLALERLGGHVIRRPSGAFRVIGGGMGPGELRIDASLSSQFVSALMLIAPRIGGLRLHLLGRVVSLPYLELTRRVLAAFDVEARLDGATVTVARGTPHRASPFVVEADASSAAPWWAAAALLGGRIEVQALSRDTPQADAALLAILERMGASVEDAPDGGVVVVGSGAPLAGAGEVDLGHAPDLLPLVGALGATARGETRVVGASHAMHKESDRRVTTVAAIHALGGDAEVTDDGIVVRGRPLTGGRIRAADDHRIVLAFGILGLAVGGVEISGAEAVSKSYPEFPERLLALAGG